MTTSRPQPSRTPELLSLPDAGRLGSFSADFAAIFKMTSLGVAQSDPATRCIITANPAFCAITGYPEPELIGMNVDEINHPEDRARDAELFARYLRGESPDYQCEKRYVRKDGRIIWVSVNGNAVRDDRGRAVRTIALVQDITARKAAERISDLYRVLSASSRDVMIFFDCDALIIEANQAAIDAYGYTREELVGQSFYNIRAEQTRADIPRQIERARSGPLRFETIHVRKDGSLFPVEVTWSSSTVENQPVILCVIRDITERKGVEQALQQSRARERAFLEQLPVGVWFLNARGEIVYGNPAVQKVWEGSRLVEIDRFGEYKGWWHGTNRQIQPEEWAAARAIRNGETTLDELIDIECFDGTRKTILNSAVPVRGEDGVLLGAVVFNQDITNRIEAEKTLAASESRFRAIFTQVTAGITQVDPTGKFVFANNRYCQIVGYTRDELLQMRMQDITAPEILPKNIELFTRLWREGIPFAIEKEYIRKDGGRVWVNNSVSPVLDDAGKTESIVCVTIDITERKKAEQELATAQEKLREHAAILERTVAERTARLRETIGELEHFSYTITHDMRAPLRAMQAFGQILREEYSERLDSMGLDYLRRIIESASRMDSLITDSLDYAKTVQTELTLEPIDADSLVRGIVESYPQFQSPRSQIVIDGTLPRVLASKAGLTQCFSNLLANAVKFVEPGKNPEVRVWAETGEKVVRIWVEDNGIGIPPDQHERVFAMFQRMSKQYEGTGVGLALVRKVVEKMRGKVGVVSAPGQGSRFWVELASAARNG